MPATGSIGVGEFVDENKLRAALEDRVEIHLGQEVTLVLDLLSWDRLETFEQRFGLAPAMRLDEADHDIDPFASPGLGRQQHLICLADPRRSAEKNLKPAAALLFRCGKQCLR
jgi:hypothetical protein